ncbi:MAG TPA: L,D-transpeptidase [Solirubrobacteraceae bacterium]|nr:L,D-transpeptidase [Solirubrobacteraceae bacterium]
MRGRLLLGTLLIFGVLAPAAWATSVKPPHASSKLSIQGAFSVQRQTVTVVGRPVTVAGTVRPYVPGQSVIVRAYVGRQLISQRRLGVRASHGGSYGYYSEQLGSPIAGQVSIVATHSATSLLGAFRATQGFGALDSAVGFGATGRFVELLQQRLAALHFYIPQTGVYDQGTGLALDAYHRLLRWGTYQTLDHQTVTWLLNGWGAFKVRYPRDGRHAEGNLSIQLLALIDHGAVQRIYPISSGKPSTPTILGRFQVYSKVPGYLPDGMYFSNFFIGGYAIHGYDPAPDYPASHGCMRVPIVDAISIYDWLRIGNRVDVYYGG